MRFKKKMNMGRGIIKGFNCLKHVWNEIFFLKKKVESWKGNWYGISRKDLID